MKIRTGFVSNSSSSSYIIAFDKSAKLCIGNDSISIYDFLNLVAEEDDSLDCVEYTHLLLKGSKNEFISKFKEYFYEDLPNELTSAIDNVSDDKEFVMLQINYKDKFAQKFYDILKNNKVFEELDKYG